MGHRVKRGILPPDAWGCCVNRSGELSVGGCSTVDLAKRYGTPLHVVNESRLEATAGNFRRIFEKTYPGKVSVHFALKCNGVPGVLKRIFGAGLKAEVMSVFELALARHLGIGGKDIVVNGPCKTEFFLRQCIESDVKCIVVDSLEELDVLIRLCDTMQKSIDVLLRINPDYIPRGMTQGSATGSRKGCAFGLDLLGGEVDRALDRLQSKQRVRFKGFHFHIGTGIRYPKDYLRALQRIKSLIPCVKKRGFRIEIFDVGGGFAAKTTREMSSCEMILYQSLERLPAPAKIGNQVTFEAFAEAISTGLQALFSDEELPELIVEPGRSIVSSNQLLLLTVHRVKHRSGVKKWLITDGGLGTVSMPTYYEYHELFLCNNMDRPRTEKVTIIGPVCFAGDVVYKNKIMPEVFPGELLAVMDSGAYFTSWESTFGFPRPAILSVKDGRERLLRRRECFTDFISRDNFDEDKMNRMPDTGRGKGVMEFYR